MFLLKTWRMFKEYLIFGDLIRKSTNYLMIFYFISMMSTARIYYQTMAIFFTFLKTWWLFKTDHFFILFLSCQQQVSVIYQTMAIFFCISIDKLFIINHINMFFLSCFLFIVLQCHTCAIAPATKFSVCCSVWLPKFATAENGRKLIAREDIILNVLRISESLKA